MIRGVRVWGILGLLTWGYQYEATVDIQTIKCIYSVVKNKVFAWLYTDGEN